MLCDRFRTGAGVVTVVVCGEVALDLGAEGDEVLIAAIILGGSGTGDCLVGTVAEPFGIFAAELAALAKPSTACLSGGGGFTAPEEVGRPFCAVDQVAVGGGRGGPCCVG